MIHRGISNYTLQFKRCNRSSNVARLEQLLKIMIYIYLKF